jgi:exoribonuclease R
MKRNTAAVAITASTLAVAATVAIAGPAISAQMSHPPPGWTIVSIHGNAGNGWNYTTKDGTDVHVPSQNVLMNKCQHGDHVAVCKATQLGEIHKLAAVRDALKYVHQQS